jgi:hypothetical protein
MISPVRSLGALLLAATSLSLSLIPATAAVAAAPCPTSGVVALPIGSVAPVPAGAQRSFSLALGANEGVIIDLSDIKPKPAPENAEGEDAHESSASAPTVRALRLCDGTGKVLAPMAGEVFAKGGSVTATDDGERLRFLPGQSGMYLVTVAAGDAPRELLVRRRDVGSVQAPVIAATLDAGQKGITSSNAPVVYSFAGAAGQWVELKSTSEKDTLLRLAGPDRAGTYAVLAENDDSDGLNPVIRRKLPVAGTYYLQVDSLSNDPGEFELSLKRIEAPKPPPPPMALRAGGTVAGRLADGDDYKLYALPVVAGHAYRLELTAPYDGVVGIGVPNPVEPEDGGSGPDAGYSDVKSSDANTSGTEKLDFTARSNGSLLVRIKSFGIGETNGGYTLTVNDLGS